MGNCNSGNRSKRYGARILVTDCLCIDVSQLRQKVSIANNAPSVTFAMGTSKFRFALEWTGCNYGSVRPWFRCPGCDRRCAKVYLPARAPYPPWKCRQCLNLTYPSSNVSNCKESIKFKRERASAKFRKATKNPNWHPIFNKNAIKPRGMHERTFIRLYREVIQSEWDFLKDFSVGTDKMLLDMGRRIERCLKL